MKKPGSDEEREQFEDEAGLTPSGLLRMPFEACTSATPDDTFDEDYGLVVSVNGKPLPQFSVDLLSEDAMQAPGSDMEVLVMHDSFGLLFFNPVLSTNLGLLELLRFQLEDLALDVNCQQWSGPRMGYSTELPLILHSMVQPDIRLFQYLFSFNGIDLNPVLRRSPMTDDVLPDGTGLTLLHGLNFIIGGSLNGKFDMRRLKQLLSHDDVDINGGPDQVPPLYGTLVSPIRLDSDLDLVKAYVEAGANAGPAFTAASSREFENVLGQVYATTLTFLNEKLRRAVSTSGGGAALMVSKHRRLMAFVRQLIGESGQE